MRPEQIKEHRESETRMAYRARTTPTLITDDPNARGLRTRRIIPRPSTALSVALIVAFTLLIVWSFMLVRDKLLSNANEMGTHLAKSYASEEQAHFDSFEQLLSMGAHMMSDSINAGADQATLQTTLEAYARHVSDILGANTADPYAVIDGRIIAANPWEGDSSYDFASTAWYQNALGSGKDIAYTDVYTDAITGSLVVTLSCPISGTGNVFAADIRLSDFVATEAGTNLPRNSSYFLTDADGSLIHASSSLNLADESTRSYLNNLTDAILDGKLSDYDDTIPSIDGEQCVVYYSILSSGWISVVTIPLETILQDGWNTTFVVLAAICLGLVCMLVATIVRERLKNRAFKNATDTLTLLGDTFYAIYRINVADGRYAIVKAPDDTRAILGPHGSYDQLLDAVGSVVEKSTHEAFVESFSLDHIRQLFGKGVREFGGDYQRRFGDEYKWVSIRMLQSDDIGMDEAVMSFREIDGEKRMEIQHRILLENALSIAEQASKNKSDLVSNVSHDLRTPLTAIIGLSEIAQRNIDDAEKTVASLRKIEASGRKMLAFVNGVLDMARLEHGGDVLDLEPVSLVEIVGNTVSIFEAQTENDGKRLVVDAPSHMKPVMADELRITQVLMNLVSNAVKYTERGNTIHVTLRQATEGDTVNDYQIIVEDNGIGMSEEFLKRVFEPYTRETMFGPSKVTGTGLGMPIVKSIVARMDGTIDIASQLGQGTRITITLPLRTAPVAVFEAQGDERERESGDGASTEAEREDACTGSDAQEPLRGIRVLVADDTDINREIIQEYLLMLGAEVTHARNGREAVDLFECSEIGGISCILMDMRMPDMDGCEAAQAIRALNRSDAAAVPIIAITANTSPEDVARTAAAGMNGHVTKPIDFASFTQVMQNALQ